MRSCVVKARRDGVERNNEQHRLLENIHLFALGPSTFLCCLGWEKSSLSSGSKLLSPTLWSLLLSAATAIICASEHYWNTSEEEKVSDEG